MLIRLLLIIILIVISLFCWLSLLNPLDVEFRLRQKDFPALHRLLAEIYLHKKDFTKAAQEFEKTFELSGTSYLPFTCTACKRESKEWIAYCPQCHQWSTYTIEERDKAFTIPAFSSSEQLPLPFRLNAQRIPL